VWLIAAQAFFLREHEMNWSIFFFMVLIGWSVVGFFTALSTKRNLTWRYLFVIDLLAMATCVCGILKI